MAERRKFDVGDDQVEIYAHPDGAVTIEAEADYGDSDMGWGATTKTIHMSEDMVEAFITFLQTRKSANR